MNRTVRVGSTSLLFAGLLLMVLGLLPDAAGAFDFKLSYSESWYSPKTGVKKQYEFGNTPVFEFVLPVSGGTIENGGTVEITNFSLPGAISSVPRGITFEFTSVPSTITGNVSVLGNLATIIFSPITVDFTRGTPGSTPSSGTLQLSLSTLDKTIEADGCGEISADEPFNGINLSLTDGLPTQGSPLGLTAFLCPYPQPADTYDEVFRLQLFGTVPEPGTAALVASGMLLLGAVARRKSTS